MSTSRLQQWFNLLSVLKYGLFFFLLLTYLPFTAFPGVPGSSLFGGLFVGLSPFPVFWAAVAFFAAAWSLSFTLGLLVDTAEMRWDPAAPALHQSAAAAAPGAPAGPQAVAPGLAVHLPDWAARFFGVPTTRGHFLLASAQAVLGLLVVLWHAERPWLGALAAAAGGVGAYLLLLLVSMPARLVEPRVFVAPRSLLGRWLFRLANRRWLVRFFTWVRDAISWLLYRLGVRHLLVPETVGGRTRWRLVAPHFFALSCMGGLVLLALAAAWLFFPPRPVFQVLSAAAMLYILLTLLIWTLLGLDSHLSRLRLSPLLVVVLWMLFIWWAESADHDYQVRLRPRAQPEELSPLEAAAASRAPGNLVVVASSGGGILAAGWTTLVLKELAPERPQLLDEIRLLSTVSGSSIGAAHYASRLRREEDPAFLPHDRLGDALQQVYERSVASSLAEAAYGFALLDFWRLFFARPPLYPDWDRGRLLENAWGRSAGEVELPFSSLRGPIREGRIPALIFGSTVLEKGQRLMLTPLSFTDDPEQVRAMTLSEFLGAAPGSEADLNLWTAARMSATFPFVSPAARAAVEGEGGGAGPAALHLIDGGYFDNYGVTSALDWLEPVLAARLAGDPRLSFRRVVVLRLNAFSATDPAAVQPISGSLAALAGPLLGIVNLQVGTAVSRNASELARFTDAWNARFADARRAGADLDVCLEQVELRPPASGEEPLSWHMTAAQIEDQQRSWQAGFAEDQRGVKGSLRQQWEVMRAFLDSPSCPAEAKPVTDLEGLLAAQEARQPQSPPQAGVE